MATLNQRLEALEKLIADQTPFAPVQFIVLDIGRDAPEEYERKQRQVKEIEAKGEMVIVYQVIDARVKHCEA